MASGYPIYINGTRILSSEALYQACRYPHLPEVQKEIIAQSSPMTAKMKGKPYKDNSRQDWGKVCTRIMRWCLQVKLAQNYEEFGRLLKDTGDKPIVEQSNKDDFWGAKVSSTNSELLIGYNILGRLLMELRENLKEDANCNLREVNPLDIENFLLLGEPIGMISSPDWEKTCLQSNFLDNLDSKK